MTQYIWWQKGIIYQIYPRSYQDSNADGIGDLPGIIQRLDYLKSLNIEAIWLSPIYPSPMYDFGYDVANYTAINPIFGTMADFDQLLVESHQRGLKVMLDLVPNHTSSEHAWFLESRSSRDNPKRDWYIWRDPAPDGGVPNNWLSYFGGSAWTFDEQTGQYYLHQFLKEQPELNYRHHEVLPTMLNEMRFWLNKGVDGFRVDVICLMLKDDQFRNEPPNPEWDGKVLHGSLQHIYTNNLPGVHDLIRQMRGVLNEYADRMMVGEIYMPYEDLVTYYGQNMDGCHLPFNFQLILTPWQAQAVREVVELYESVLPSGAWPNWVLGNHDQHRLATRVGANQARVANMLLLTLRGTPTYYYGDEIGMEDGTIPPEFVQDPPALKQPEVAHIVGRDPERTPMQWNSDPNAGFTAEHVIPWLPLPADYAERNVAKQETEPTAMLKFFRALTALRQTEPSLSVGDYASVETGVADIFAYLRTAPNSDRFLVVLNFGALSFESAEHRLNLSQVAPRATIAVATDMVRTGLVDLTSLSLAPNEGLVLRL